MSIGKTRQGAAQASGCWIRREKRLAIYIRDSFRCLYCGADLRHVSPANITLDHLLPRSSGGANGAVNLVTACRACNSARGARPWLDYASGGAADRIEQLRRESLNLELARALIAGEAGDRELETAR